MDAPLGVQLTAAVRPIGRQIRRISASGPARVTITLSALALAAWVIRGQLEQIRLSDVLAAARATPPPAIALSAVFTALSYACLAVVEWQALRIIGLRQPRWRTAIASFASNAVSLVMGFGLVSGVAARLRAYRFAKLKPTQVGRLVVLLTGATLLSGVITEGLSLLFRLPRSLAAFPTGWIEAAGSLALLAPAALWFTLFRFRRSKRRTPLTLRERAGVLAAGLGDWIFSGAALFVLSSHDLAAFPAFLSIFCLGSLLGSIVGVPAGIGILEAVILSLHDSRQPHQTAAALLLYRAIYFLGPLMLTAIGALSMRTAKIAARLASPPAVGPPSGRT